MRLSKITILWAIFIVGSASFALQLLKFVQRIFGQRIPYVVLGAIFILLGLKFAYYIIRQHFFYLRIIYIFLVFLTGLILSLKIELVAERFHLVEYGFLGWLSMSDLIKNKSFRGAIIWSLVFALLVGLSDELFQKFLPYRVGEMRDVFMNVIGGVWGICLFVGLERKLATN